VPSWWVGLSRDKFSRAYQTHKFSVRWKDNYTPPDTESTKFAKLRERNRRVISYVYHYRSVGFSVNQVRVVLVNDHEKEKDDLESIPYYERQLALENRNLLELEKE